ncbi:MarR family winged helix-turn-helix transcriptional regulator [Streptomyces hilarionis]|uniref:MarR family winged helix-turn-helix transcriptional regulator n=1 Tax=Streptomyces hilarionis TaxID=2839954 RepID=UPI00211AA251|nr:MarR family transcriptional regulator [Streptomyces hilarionis]
MTATRGRTAAGNGAPEGAADGNAPGDRPATGAPDAAGGAETTGGSTPADAGTLDTSQADDSRAGDRARGDDRVAGRGRGGDAERNDTVAAVVRQWQTVRPDLDTGPMEIIGRVNRCAALLQQAEDAPLRAVGLSRPEFDLLGALRRTGRELTPGDLARETFSSGAAVTKRLKQLTERGLVERRGDTRDRRVAHLRLTDAGRDVVDGVLPEQLAYESAVLSALDDGSQGELADLLGELLSRLEGHMRTLRV